MRLGDGVVNIQGRCLLMYLDSSYIGSSNGSFASEANVLYNHLLFHRKQETTQAVIDRFQQLFITGNYYPDGAVMAARDQILTSKSEWADAEFLNILNRCCYILINHWWLQAEFKPDLKQATIDLVNLFLTQPTTAADTCPTERMRALVQEFITTPPYEELQRRARVAGADPSSQQPRNSAQTAAPISELIDRYPLLYPYYLRLEEDSSEAGGRAVKQLQRQREQKFEHDLLWYATNLKLKRDTQAHSKVENPTLLSPDQVNRAIYQFAGKSQGTKGYHDLACAFHQEIGQVRSYKSLKHGLYDYLTEALQHSNNPGYGKHNFNNWLSNQLQDLSPQRDHLRPNGMLLVQTCGKVLSLLVNPPQAGNHFIFLDMIGNLGATFTIGLLLKLVLLCRDVKTNLEAIRAHLAKQFATMFRHYEKQTRQELAWLIECLDHLMIASTVHFGQKGYHSWSNLI
jgi:hypothetical protein